MRRLPSILLPLTIAAFAALAVAESFVWVDEHGVTHMTDDAERVPEALRRPGGTPHGARNALWEGPLGAAADALPPGPLEDAEQARTRRLLWGAVQDLKRGETARAAVALESVLREEPSRPEAHWYLAGLDRHRGRHESAEAHLRAFLAAAGDDLEPWRGQAAQRLRELEDERRLAAEASASAPDQWAGLESGHFHLVLDPGLERGSAHYARTALAYLEGARAHVMARLGTTPDQPMGVVFYGRRSYDQVHAQRFSFRTVGFFDGRIHVVSAAHPSEELRALLFHEYVHAVFREQTGGDHPYWWNEGLAELAERESRAQPGLTRSERSALRRKIDARDWLPLRRLGPSFSGLDDEQARAAYLEATAAALWIEGRSTRAQRAALLARLGEGRDDDAAFQEVLGIGIEAIDAGVQDWIRSEFPSLRALRAPQPARPPARESPSR